MKKEDIKLEESDLFIPQNSSRIIGINIIKPRAAYAASAAAKEVKDEEGNATTAAIKAVEAKPARDGYATMRIAFNTEKILKESINRMAMIGIWPKEGHDISQHHTGPAMTFIGPTQSAIRAALKETKGKGKFNKKGTAVFEANVKAEKAEKAEKEKAKRDNFAKEQAPEKKKEEPKKVKEEPKKAAKKLSKKSKKPVEGDDWPE